MFEKIFEIEIWLTCALQVFLVRTKMSCFSSFSEGQQSEGFSKFPLPDLSGVFPIAQHAVSTFAKQASHRSYQLCLQRMQNFTNPKHMFPWTGGSALQCVLHTFPAEYQFWCSRIQSMWRSQTHARTETDDRAASTELIPCPRKCSHSNARKSELSKDFGKCIQSLCFIG